jgi:hypothetical protein
MYGIDLHDELTQAKDPNPAWRESFWFDLVDRRQGVGLLIYVGVQPGEGKGFGLVHMADRERGVLFQERDFGLEVDGHEAGRSEIEVGPFEVALVQPLQSQRIRFDRAAARFEVDFSSTGVIYDYPWGWTGSRHYEQLGEATAAVTLPDTGPLELSGAAARDHAWGLRGLRPWRYWLWMTCRGEQGEPSWSACWVEDEEHTQLLGHLVDEDGGVHTLRALEADVDYAGLEPERVRLEMTFGRRPPLVVELEMFGAIDLSQADSTKQGGYYFAFAEGGGGSGTFDVFWRGDLEQPRRVVIDER